MAYRGILTNGHPAIPKDSNDPLEAVNLPGKEEVMKQKLELIISTELKRYPSIPTVNL